MDFIIYIGMEILITLNFEAIVLFACVSFLGPAFFTTRL